MSARARILLVHPSGLDPERPRTGGEQRQALIWRHLSSLGEVTPFQATRWNAPGVPGYFKNTKSLADANRAAALHGDLRRHRPDGEGARAYAGLPPEAFDLIFVCRAGTAWWTGCCDPRRAILDLDDVDSRTFAQDLARQRHGLGERLRDRLRLERLRRSERRLADAFRFVLVADEADCGYLRRDNVACLPNSYWPHPAMGEEEATPRSDVVTFVGTLFWPPNDRGLAWFTERVWPRVMDRRPDLRLHLVGHQRKRRDEDLAPWARAPGVEFVGRVDDVAPYIRQSLCTVCPIFDGSGTRIKILESLAFGTPVVSTGFGAQGLGLHDEDGVLLRDEPESFARAILELAAEPQRRSQLAKNGRHAVATGHSPDVQRAALARVLETVLAESSR